MWTMSIVFSPSVVQRIRGKLKTMKYFTSVKIIGTNSEVCLTATYLDTWMACLHLLCGSKHYFHCFRVWLAQPLWFPRVPKSTREVSPRSSSPQAMIAHVDQRKICHLATSLTPRWWWILLLVCSRQGFMMEVTDSSTWDTMLGYESPLCIAAQGLQATVKR